MQLLSEANRLMGQRAVELEGQLHGGRSGREVAMERELAEVGRECGRGRQGEGRERGCLGLLPSSLSSNPLPAALSYI